MFASKSKIFLFSIVIFVNLFFISFVDAQSKIRVKVATSIEPLAYFTKQIGGEFVEVSSMVTAGANAHTYEPKPKQLQELSRADLYIKVGSGLEFETIWIDKFRAINKNMYICDSSKGIRFIGSKNRCQHEDHSETGHDPHVWLSIKNAVVMVENIKNALVEIDPSNKQIYEERTKKLLLDLETLDREIINSTEHLPIKTFAVYHPGLGYYADEYGLEELAIEQDGKEPNPKQLMQLIDEAKKNNVKIVFVSPGFNKNIAKTVADSIGAVIIEVNFLEGEYLDNLKYITQILIKYNR